MTAITNVQVADVLNAFQELEARGYRRPAEVDASRWAADFRHIAVPVFRRAVLAWVHGDAQGSYWPKPGVILAACTARNAAVPLSLREPEPRDWDWYALRPGQEGPIVRYLPKAEGQRRGLALAEDAVCPDAACRCDAVRITCFTAHAFGAAFGRVLRDRPPERWVWAHHAAGLPGAGYAVQPRA